ncbi:MAG: ABC transporter ATP-binding protein [Deltaproteobacteria bacterium]
MKNRIRQFWRLIVPYRKTALVAFLAILVASLLDLVYPWAIKMVVDDVIPKRDLGLLCGIAGGMIAVSALKFLFGFIREYLFALIGENSVYDLRTRIYWHLQALSVSYREKVAAGTVISGLIGDVDSIKNFLFGGMIDFIFSLFMALFLLVVLFVLSWQLALISMLFIPFFVILYIKATPELRGRLSLVRKKYAELTSRIGEVLNGMRVVAGFGREGYEAGLFDAKQGEIRSAAMKSHKRGFLLWMGSEFFSYFGLTSALFVGAVFAIRGSLSAGSLVAFLAYLGMVFAPVIRMTVIGNYYQEACAAIDRINGVLSCRPDVDDVPGASDLAAVRGHIRFDHVSFSYPGGKEVLSGVDLDIAAGSTVAIVGKSGAGKTTLIDLLLRFYDPSDGVITVDGRDIRRATLKSLRGCMAMVLQDDYLFSGSIRDNILYGRPDAGCGEMEAAAKAANAHDFILRLPGGYDAAVGEGGVRLSYGQRKRISIARAIVRDPRILILDEATSAVDSLTERSIVDDAYERVMAGRTTIVIAHRLGIVKAADRIVVIDEGRIVEQGDHRSLIEARGHYWRMWDEQFRQKEGSPL